MGACAGAVRWARTKNICSRWQGRLSEFCLRSMMCRARSALAVSLIPQDGRSIQRVQSPRQARSGEVRRRTKELGRASVYESSFVRTRDKAPQPQEGHGGEWWFVARNAVKLCATVSYESLGRRTLLLCPVCKKMCCCVQNAAKHWRAVKHVLDISQVLANGVDRLEMATLYVHAREPARFTAVAQANYCRAYHIVRH